MDIDARTGMQILAEDECWRLLESATVGRLAVAPGGRPDIFPVNFLAINGTLVFRTAEGSKLTSVAVNHAVALEIDGYEPETNQAWSVVVSGTARPVTSDDDAAVLEELPLTPWHATPKHHFVEIVPIKVTGRKFLAEGRSADDPTTFISERERSADAEPSPAASPPAGEPPGEPPVRSSDQGRAPDQDAAAPATQPRAPEEG